MKLIFSTSNRLGSRAIAWGTDGEASHVALLFDEDTDDGVIFHATGAHGTLPMWFSEFKKKNKIVYALEFSPALGSEVEDRIFKKMITEYAGQKYDYKALLFWLVMGLRRKIFGTALPDRNAWAKAGYNLCTAMIGLLAKEIPSLFWGPNIDWEMISPDAIYHLLSKREGFYIVGKFP